MSRKNYVIFIMDALRADHLCAEYMPFLKSLSKSGKYAQLEISPGFCERTEILTGLNPRKTKLVHAFTYKNDRKNLYSWLNPKLSCFFQFIENNILGERITRRMVWTIGKYMNNLTMYPQRIPYALLGKVALTEDALTLTQLKKKFKCGLIQRAFIEGLEISEKYFTSLSGGNNSNGDVFKNVVKDLTYSKNKLYLVYISVADMAGHKYGTHTKKMINELRNLDKRINLFYQNVYKKIGDNKIIFIGDHGMENIEKTIDLRTYILDFIDKYALKIGIDVNYFIDSTTLRIWLTDKTKTKKIQSYLLTRDIFKQYGIFLNNDICFDENLPNLNEIADIVWWANLRIQIAPNYFCTSIGGKKGMHGYLNRQKPSKGFILVMDKDQDNVKIGSISPNQIENYIFNLQ